MVLGAQRLTTPSDDMKLPASFANHFVDLEGKPITGANKIDEFLKINAGSSYEFASSNFEDKGVIKTNFRVYGTSTRLASPLRPEKRHSPRNTVRASTHPTLSWI